MFTIVTPSYEKHFLQYSRMLEGIVTNCVDIDLLQMIIVIEKQNEVLFNSAFDRYPTLRRTVIFTEDILISFGIKYTPRDFLKNKGKFTFQALKKLGALRQSTTEWSVVLDSESLFLKEFSIRSLFEDYIKGKYVFYSDVKVRGSRWEQSTGAEVNKNVSIALSFDATKRWYMEYFHWFYETAKVIDLLDNKLDKSFYALIRSQDTKQIDYFENILYYSYLERHHPDEYRFIEIRQAISASLPAHLAARFDYSVLPFSLFGNDYILNVLSPAEISALQAFFDRYRLPFMRLEPPVFSPNYLVELVKLPSLIATVSSHHQVWLRKKIAVCVSGEFRHNVHRAPEKYANYLKAFLAGVDCDIFLHGWSNPDEAYILEVLQPRSHKFEPKLDLSELEGKIRLREPNLKAGRDEGSLAMFYGLKAVYDLVEPHVEDYDFILRIRPDLFLDLSLKDVLIRITDVGDYLPSTIYFPKHFHSKGINDQWALGPTNQMKTYFNTFDYINHNIDKILFNPEVVLLQNLLAKSVRLAVAPVPYALMRAEPMFVGLAAHILHVQEHTWWSRTDVLPPYEDLTEYFGDKLAAITTLLGECGPQKCFVPGQLVGGQKGQLLELRVQDNDPAMHTAVFSKRFGLLFANHAKLSSGSIIAVQFERRETFLIFQGRAAVLSEWHNHNGRLTNIRYTFDRSSLLPANFFSDRTLHSAWWRRSLLQDTLPNALNALRRILARPISSLLINVRSLLRSNS